MEQSNEPQSDPPSKVRRSNKFHPSVLNLRRPSDQRISEQIEGEEIVLAIEHFEDLNQDNNSNHDSPMHRIKRICKCALKIENQVKRQLKNKYQE